jgi:hypothetical protein
VTTPLAWVDAGGVAFLGSRVTSVVCVRVGLRTGSGFCTIVRVAKRVAERVRVRAQRIARWFSYTTRSDVAPPSPVRVCPSSQNSFA